MSVSGATWAPEEMVHDDRSPVSSPRLFSPSHCWSIHWFRSRIAASPSLPTVRRRSTASASSSALASESSLGDTPPHARVGIDTRTVPAQSLAGTFVDIVVTLETDEIFHELNVHKRSTGETTDARTCMAAGVRCRPTA